VTPDVAYKTMLTSGQFSLVADEPVSAGGGDEGPAPGDYLCMALAACKAITLRMYVRRKQWEVGEINVAVNLVKTEDTAGMAIHTFQCELLATRELSNEQKQRLLQIDKACPISKILVKGAEIISTIS
jgi:putative redox protein